MADDVSLAQLERALRALKAIDAYALDRVDLDRLSTAEKLLKQQIDQLKQRIEVAV